MIISLEERIEESCSLSIPKLHKDIVPRWNNDFFCTTLGCILSFIRQHCVGVSHTSKVKVIFLNREICYCSILIIFESICNSHMNVILYSLWFRFESLVYKMWTYPQTYGALPFRNECFFFWVNGNGSERRTKSLELQANEPRKKDAHSLCLQCFEQTLSELLPEKL